MFNSHPLLTTIGLLVVVLMLFSLPLTGAQQKSPDKPDPAFEKKLMHLKG